MMHRQAMRLITASVTLSALLITVSASVGRNKGKAPNLEPQWYLRLTVLAPAVGR